jgi:hypothetical protein
VILASSGVRQMGVAESVLRFGEAPKAKGTWAGARRLWIGGQAAFELTFWCGTCPILFQRLNGATGTLSIAELEKRLGRGLNGIDSEVLSALTGLLPTARYLPMLLQVTPRLVTPAGQDDYYAHEQVATWGLDGSWGLPENPRTPYYRTFETPVTTDAHLYEFVVPMVPPTWNDPAQVRQHARTLSTSSQPTAVAVSTLDIAQPAVTNHSSDYYEHWALTHFLLDGHHKLAAAATTARPLQLLTLVTIDASLADAADIRRLPAIRAQPARSRP